MSISYIREFGAQLAASFQVCAITPGDKRPIGRGWQDHPLTPEDCASFATEDAGVGIILGKGEYPCYAIDVDVAGDEECANELREFIAGKLQIEEQYLIYRVGNAPKFLVPVCGMEAGWKKAMTPWFEKDGHRSRIEFLGEGQQFVALAIHPVTNKPYEWRGMPLINDFIDPPQCLPKVSRELVNEILAGSADIFLSHGWKKSDGGTVVNSSTDASADELAPQYRMGASIEQATKWLSDFPGKDDYDTWLKVGMALHHEFGRSEFSEDAIGLWDKWSSGGKAYRGRDDIAYRWDSFGKRSGRSVTCRWLKYEYEKRHYDFSAEMTEEGRIARFVRYYEGSLKYALDADRWYKWNGLIWQPLFQSEVDAMAREILGPVLRDDIEEMCKTMDSKDTVRLWKFYGTMQAAGKAHTIAQGAEKCEQLWCKTSDFNSIPRYFGVRNGVIDLETQKFKPAEKSMMVSLQANVDFDSSATCPRWEQTVSEIFFEDKDLVDYVQRLFGYMMLGNPTEEIMAIFHGNGSNGKSTLMHVLTDLFGGYAHTASADLVTSIGNSKSSAGGARADIVALQHKRLVVMSELDMKARMQEATLKSLVSLDAISARGLYESGIRTFRPSWVVTMLTNYMPRIDGADDGIWRRIHAVPFDRNFDSDKAIKKDTHLVEKLEAESSGILNWLLEGVRKYKERGLKQPEKVKAESSEYKQSMDIIGEWLTERCRMSADERVPAALAYNAWDIYSKANGVDYLIKSRTDLTKVLKKRGIECKPVVFEGKMQRCYYGFTLNEQSIE